MRRAWMVPVCVGLMAALLAACADVGDQVDGLVEAADSLRSEAAGAGDEAAFCLALARTAAAVESGSPTTAEEAAEEALARAPEGLVDATRDVTETLREARDSGAGVRDEDLAEHVSRLVDVAADVCDPR
jgi:hypothetical protein